MESNDSEISECLNLLRPPVRRDYKTNKSGYSNNFHKQTHSVNFLSEWRKPKKRKPSGHRLRRGLEASTSLILQKKKSSEQIFDSTATVVSYTCLPNTRGQKPIHNQGSANCYHHKQQLKIKADKPVIQVIVIPNEEGENQIEKHKLPKINDNSNKLNSIETKNIYLVVVDKHKEKVYELKTTDTAAIAEEVKDEDVGHVFHGVDCFKQIIKSLTMEKKKQSVGGNKPEILMPSTEHMCQCFSSCGKPNIGCCEDNPPPCQPPPCQPPPCQPPCPPPPNPSQEYPPMAVGVGRNRVTIHGQLGINEEDRFVMKCAATVDDKPVIPEFYHVGVKAPANREMVDEWEPKDKYGPGKTIIIRPRAMDKVTQCSCKCSANEIDDSSELEDSQNPVVVISVFPKDQDGISEITPRKQHVLHESRRPFGPATNQYDYNDDFSTAPLYTRRVNNFTQDGESQVLNRNYNDGQVQTMRSSRPRQATNNTVDRENTPYGRPRSNYFNDQEKIMTFKPKMTTNVYNQDYTRETKLSQDVASQVMGLNNINGGQILMTHNFVEPPNTQSNYTQNHDDQILRNTNKNFQEYKFTRNTSTQDGPEHNKRQRSANRFRGTNISFSPDREDQRWVPNTGIPRTCINKTCTNECSENMMHDDGNVNKTRGTINKNMNCEMYRGPNRSVSPLPKHKRNTVKPHIVETSLVKTKRSKSPIPTNKVFKETKKNVTPKQKATTTAVTSRSTLNTKRPKSKTQDKMNSSNQFKSKTFIADNYKKIVNDRVDEYNRKSPKHDVSRISVNIDSENECYDVSFHQGLNTTDLTVRKTLKGKTGSLQNLFCKSNTMCTVKNSSNNNGLPESNSRFHARDSLEISHRHSQKTEMETQGNKTDKNFSVSNDNLINFAPIKHFTGDNCTIRNPIERDKEIRELLGIPRRITTSQKNESQRHTLFGDKTYITQPIFDDPKCKTVTVNYSSLCSCCCVNKGEAAKSSQKENHQKPTRKPKPVKHKKKTSPTHVCGCYPSEKIEKIAKKKKKVEGTNLYQQLILNRNIQVFLQVEQFCKQKPICLSKKQYDKVKKTIRSTLSKNKHLQAIEKKQKQAEVQDKSSPLVQKPLVHQEESANEKKDLHPKIESDEDKQSPLQLEPLEKKLPRLLAKRLTRVSERISLEDKAKSPEIELQPLEEKPARAAEKKTTDEKNVSLKKRKDQLHQHDPINTDSCCQNHHCVQRPAGETHVCCKCNKKPFIKYMHFRNNDSPDTLDMTPKQKKMKEKANRSRCPCIQSLISIGEVRLKPRQPKYEKKNALNKVDNYPDLDDNPLLEEQDVDQEVEVVEDANFDLADVVDDDDDECLDPCIMAPSENAWLEYKRFKKRNKGVETVVLYKRNVKPHNIDARQTMSSVEVRYANVAYINQVTFSSTNVFDSLLSDSSLALKDPISIETLFKGHTKSPTPNLGTSTMSCVSEPSCPESSLRPEKPARRPFLRRLMSCLVMRSDRTPGPNLTPPKYRAPTVDSSFDSYHFSSSLGAIDMTSSLYDTSASFYSNHSVLPQNSKLSKRGFLNSVRGFLFIRKS